MPPKRPPIAINKCPFAVYPNLKLGVVNTHQATPRPHDGHQSCHFSVTGHQRHGLRQRSPQRKSRMAFVRGNLKRGRNRAKFWVRHIDPCQLINILFDQPGMDITTGKSCLPRQTFQEFQVGGRSRDPGPL